MIIRNKKIRDVNINFNIRIINLKWYSAIKVKVLQYVKS